MIWFIDPYSSALLYWHLSCIISDIFHKTQHYHQSALRQQLACRVDWHVYLSLMKNKPSWQIVPIFPDTQPALQLPVTPSHGSKQLQWLLQPEPHRSLGQSVRRMIIWNHSFETWYNLLTRNYPFSSALLYWHLSCRIALFSTKHSTITRKHYCISSSIYLQPISVYIHCIIWYYRFYYQTHLLDKLSLSCQAHIQQYSCQ